MVKQITSVEDFMAETSNGKVLVDFFATWCGPCKMLSPQLDAFAKDSDVKVIKVDADAFKSLTDKFTVMGLPTLVLLQDGAEVKRTTGFKRKNELETFTK